MHVLCLTKNTFIRQKKHSIWPVQIKYIAVKVDILVPCLGNRNMVPSKKQKGCALQIKLTKTNMFFVVSPFCH